MVSASEAAEEYRAVLSDLSRNDKTQINLLTILAEDYASYSSEIVGVIEESLYKCSVPLKIVMLYVIDSIVKNVQITGGYRELFAKKIVDMIVHGDERTRASIYRLRCTWADCSVPLKIVMLYVIDSIVKNVQITGGYRELFAKKIVDMIVHGDERTRASIYRLRCTWADVFTKSKLYMIDTKINSVDRAWPIMNPDLKIEVSSQQQQQTSGQQQGGGHVVHVNPKFLNGKQPPTGVKQENKQQEKQPEKIQEKKKIQPDINANKTVTNQVVKTEEVDPDKNVRQRKIPKKAKENNTSTTNKTITTTSTKTPKESGVVKSKENTNVKKPESLLSLKLDCPPQQPSQQQSSQHKGGGPPNKRPRTTTTAQHSTSNITNKSTQRSVKPQQPRVSKQNVCSF
uniref:CID domain-containing protein n=1 Tax=Meloidogyne floridensis TaxID=298350 RepID=A0A915PF22_9BILA